MNSLVIVLRIVHILSGVFWVGGAIILGYVITPAVAATGENGQKFMVHLVTQSKITLRITASAILTVVAGGSLYWIDSGGLTSGWISSPAGWGFGIGATLGLIGLIFGILVGINVSRLGRLASEIKGKPSPDQMSEIQAAQKRLKFISPINTIALILALACMATARYWRF